MATLAAIRITNIVSFTHGTSQYKGITDLNIKYTKGDAKPIVNEGDRFAVGAEVVGTMQFPVTMSLKVESQVIGFALLNAAVGTTVIVGKADGSNTNQTYTIANNQFGSASKDMKRQDFATEGIEGYAFSSDGNTLPLTIS